MADAPASRAATIFSGSTCAIIIPREDPQVLCRRPGIAVIAGVDRPPCFWSGYFVVEQTSQRQWWLSAAHSGRAPEILQPDIRAQQVVQSWRNSKATCCSPVWRRLSGSSVGSRDFKKHDAVIQFIVCPDETVKAENGSHGRLALARRPPHDG